MSVIKNISGVLHKIRVKLYPNYFPHVEGAYIARTNNDKTLSIVQVCAAMKDRGGFTGNFEQLIDNVRQFYDEVAYQLCDGFAVNTGYYSIHPNIGGTFNSVNEGHSHSKHPITFRFRPKAMLRRLVEHIDVEIEGIADVNGYIDEFFDYDELASNSIYVPGNQFSLSGHKIKIAGEHSDCGVYFVPVMDPSKAVKVKRIAENTSSKIIGIAPKTTYAQNRIEVRTQFTGSSNNYLKTPRIITSSFALEES